jgi:hydrogenase-4 component B
MTVAWPLAVVAVWLVGALWPRLARIAFVVDAAALIVWGALGLGGGGRLLAPLPVPLPPLAYAPSGAAALWCILLGVSGVAVALLLDGDGAPPAPGRARAGATSLAHATLFAAAAVVAAANWFSLLAAWETMSALAFVLFVAARPTRAAHTASYLLLLVSEIGAAALFAVVLAVGPGAGTGAGIGAGTGALAATPALLRLALSLLALVAFGSKGGLVPFQLWLPVVEPEAPGPVAGLLSGALTAAAFAALLRALAWLGPPPAALAAVLVPLGLAGLTVGSLGAVFQGDAKRVLAYGTIEAFGLAYLALGVAELFGALRLPAASALAMVGAVTLVYAHAGGKLLLFAAAGQVEQSGAGRRLDAMGGLLKRLPGTGALALVGALGLAGVPPLGAFVGEWLTLEALFQPIPGAPTLHAVLALVGAAVAVLSALALTAYLRWFGIAFLGPPRTAAAAAARPSPAGVARVVGLAFAALPLIAAGVGTPWLVPLWQTVYGSGPAIIAPLFRLPSLNRTLVAVGAAFGRGLPGASGVVLTPATTAAVLSPWDLTWIALACGVVVYAAVRVFAPGMRLAVRRVEPWAGGSPRPRPDMAYTAEGLSHPLRLALAAWAGVGRERLRRLGAGPSARYRVRYADRLHRRGYARLARFAARAAGALRRSQSGSVSQFVAWILATLVAAALIASYAR